MVKIYDSSTIDDLPWPDNEEGGYARNFLIPFIKNGPDTYIENVKTELVALHIDDHVLPVTISNIHPDNCFVCSPSSFYGGFSKERVKAIENDLLKALLFPAVNLLHTGLKKGKLDKVVYVNNWLLSTNLYPKLSDDQLVRIRDHLIEQYPDHAIAFRSINKVDSLHCFRALGNAGFHLVATRPIYIVDAAQNEHFKSRMIKSDLKILRNTEYEVIDGSQLTDQDIPRIVEIYRMLYVDKYSQLNPKLTEKFIKIIIENRILTLKLLRKDGRVDGVLGYVIRNGVINSPLFGYDTSLPKELGLYRMISVLLSLEAKEHGLLLNMSSGAGSYKTLRRAKPYIEYNAVYTKHLRLKRRVPWAILKTLMNRLASPLMVKLDN
ncbi:MAG: hypothetical protein K940chlam3_00313 [Chlamydiae bacterium]|nr:hypothetical protein [Chlamydiota bacterium]